MKKLDISVALLLLTACSPSSSFVQGEVVSCESISQDPTFTGGIELECLDGGKGAQLGGLRGPMVINVWGSWCGPCKQEMPIFVDFYSKYKDKVSLIGISVEETNAQKARDFIKLYGMSWPNLNDADGSTREILGMGVPVTLFIDAQGKVAYRKIGAVATIEELKSDTQKYLGVQL